MTNTERRGYLRSLGCEEDIKAALKGMESLAFLGFARYLPGRVRTVEADARLLWNEKSISAAQEGHPIR